MRAENADPELAAAIREHRWSELPHLTPRARALCQMAEKLSATPTAMTEADWQPLRRLGFDDQACLEVAHIVGLFNHLTRLAAGFGLQLDRRTAQAADTGTSLVHASTRRRNRKLLSRSATGPL
ncbi:MAG: carboxymuconolactone decarboxylase family protein [Acidimicrobiia bacterium]